MSKSVMSNEKRCLICGTTANLQRHHIFGASNRQKSEDHGCWCWLCLRHHTGSNQSVHRDQEMNLELKERCQFALESRHGWSRDQFREVFGKSYL